MKVLRDTDCTGVIVDWAFVPNMMVYQAVQAHCRLYFNRCAIGKRIFRFPLLQRLQGVVCELPCLPCDYWKHARGMMDVA